MHAASCQCVKNCELCAGTNIILADGMGKVCFEPNPRLIVQRMNGAGIPARFADSSFDNFTNYTGNIGAQVEYVRQWLADFAAIGGRGLLLSGPVGLGKTHLLVSIAKELIVRRVGVKFVDFFQLLSNLKGGFARMQSETSVLQPLIDVDVLIIDEMGKGRNSEWERCVLDQLVMGRYNCNKSIIASTNYILHTPTGKEMSKVNSNLEDGSADNFSVRELGALIGSRTFSRLAQMTEFLELEGEDFRRKNQNMWLKGTS
ncbi:MAG: ATP-binding protein [Pseudomonadota bacterium]|nr:ATP-binding protein [Pseudomonadota bacterium]